ncbi:unnamed protein product, partial [marine sediment metagenome]
MTGFHKKHHAGEHAKTGVDNIHDHIDHEYIQNLSVVAHHPQYLPK